MKKVLVLFVSVALIFTMTVSPVFAAGGKNHGDVGTGSVDQGDSADAPGADAQGRQAP